MKGNARKSKARRGDGHYTSWTYRRVQVQVYPTYISYLLHIFCMRRDGRIEESPYIEVGLGRPMSCLSIYITTPQRYFFTDSQHEWGEGGRGERGSRTCEMRELYWTG